LHITLPLITQHVKEGKLRGIAVADTKRSVVLPDLPTLVESGIPNHEVGYWTGVLAPAGTSNSIVASLEAHMGRILSLPDVKQRLATLGFGPLTGTSAELAGYIKTEAAEWERVVRGAKIHVD
jgi:tripartite-type tricarboxylate transporter receptor subunit TctC